jgi:hypothetical protein
MSPGSVAVGRFSAPADRPIMKIMFSACLVDQPDRNARRLSGRHERLGKPVEVILEIRHDHLVDLGLGQVAKGKRSKRRGTRAQLIAQGRLLARGRWWLAARRDRLRPELK